MAPTPLAPNQIAHAPVAIRIPSHPVGRLTYNLASPTGREGRPAASAMTEDSSTQTLGALLRPYARRAEADLRRWLVAEQTPAALAEGMAYCCLDGGKRLRAAMVYLAAEACGAPADGGALGRAAAAVEMVHAYSLVHDDLPAMDDDVLRRGRPTAHVKFGEAMAILIGDALLTRAMEVLAGAADGIGGALVAELARGAGPEGMVAGQVADMGACDVPEGVEGLQYVHRRKTGALIVAAARLGARCASADAETLATLTRYAESLGLAFQVFDDLLDVTAEAEQLGKTPGKDAAAGKRTYVSLLGAEQARRLGERHTAEAVAACPPLGAAGEPLVRLAELLAERTR